jgi:molybdopterin synthase catalytic subunit/molybdopterin converting factor small subunit
MRVRVLFFGMLKELQGAASVELDLPEGSSAANLAQLVGDGNARMRQALAICALAVNQEYAGPGAVLRDKDEVALLPPVSGGSEAIDRLRSAHCAIVREPIQVGEIVNAIKLGEDGSVLTFEGIVRNHTRGRRTVYLDYQAYEAMALKQMGALAEQAIRQFSVRDVAMVHRLGRLEIGETSVLIVVASAHRAAAFEACRWLIDTLKRTVPIWKKEYFEDGAVWADGEPFPAEIARAKE